MTAKFIISSIFICLFSVLVSNITFAEKIPQYISPKEESVTVLGNDGNDSADISADKGVREMTLKEYLLARLQLAHRKGEFLEIKESDITSLSERQLMELMNVQEHDDDALLEYYAEQDRKLGIEKEEEIEDESVFEIAKKNKKLLGFLGLASIGISYPMFGVKGGRENREMMYYFINRDISGDDGANEDLQNIRNSHSVDDRDDALVNRDYKRVSRVMNKLTSATGFCLPKGNRPFVYGINGDSDVNACCYPSDTITVNAGMMNSVGNDEDILAAALAHEIGHGVKRHGLQKQAAQCSQNFCITQVTDIWTERDADSYSFYLMANAGYNPGAQAVFFHRMAPDSLELEARLREKGLKSDHPPILERIDSTLKRIHSYSNNRVSVSGNTVMLDGDEYFFGDIESVYRKAGALAVKCHNGEI